MPLSASWAQPTFVLAQAVWEDASAQADLSVARQQAYQSFDGILSRGFSDSALWVRLTLAANNQPLVLRITPVWLDQLTLHDPASKTPPGPARSAGDLHPPQDNAFPGMGYTFDLPASAAPRQVWLRLQTTSVQLMNIKALTEAQATQQGAWQTLGAGVYACVLLLLWVALSCVWWLQPDPILGRYLLRHLAFTLYGASYLGLPALLLSDWLPPTFFDQAFSLSAIVIVYLSVRFDAAFLASFNASVRLLRLLKGVGWVSLALALLYLSGQRGLALQLNAANLMLGILILMPLALSARPSSDAEQVVPRRVMLAYYAIVCSSVLVGLVNLLGWVPANEWSLYALILHGFVTGVLASALLMVRAQRMARQHQQLGWKLQQAQDQMQAEQRHREEQSRFLHMLMHELKTPLSVVTLAVGAKNHSEKNLTLAQGAITDMKTILERCVQADQLSHQGRLALAPQLEELDLPALMDQLSQSTQRLSDRFELSLQPGLPVLRTDAQLLKIILNNLLDNAARYSDPLTPVEAFVSPAQRQDKPGLALRLRNTPGLAGWPDAEQLFAKYWRASGAQRDSGSGLGLYLSRQLADSLGACLDYAPTATHVEFILWIPLSPASTLR